MFKIRMKFAVVIAVLIVGCTGASSPPPPVATGTPPAVATGTPAAVATEAPTPGRTRVPRLDTSAGYTDLPGWIVFEHFGQAPDGSTSEFDFDNRMIWLAHADGSDLHELAPGDPVDGKVSPDISADGLMVAFSTWEPLARIYEVSIIGAGPDLVTGPECSGVWEECQEVEPSYSTDGSRIALVHVGFEDGEDGYTEIGVRDLESGSVEYLESTRVPLSEGWVGSQACRPTATRSPTTGSGKQKQMSGPRIHGSSSRRLTTRACANCRRPAITGQLIPTGQLMAQRSSSQAHRTENRKVGVTLQTEGSTPWDQTVRTSGACATVVWREAGLRAGRRTAGSSFGDTSPGR